MLNKETYDKLKKVPAEMTKKITGGRLNGMTDIKPQWRYQVLTEVFGLCGFGWKFTIDKLWTENGSAGQIFAFANITLFVKDGDVWSDGIMGNGGSMLIVSEKSGLHNSDEGFKMAITDALSTACKMIGVGADIYMGLPATKYDVQETKKEQPKTETKEKIITAELVKAEIVKQGKYTIDVVESSCKGTYQKTLAELNQIELKEVLQKLKIEV